MKSIDSADVENLAHNIVEASKTKITSQATPSEEVQAVINIIESQNLLQNKGVHDAVEKLGYKTLLEDIGAGKDGTMKFIFLYDEKKNRVDTGQLFMPLKKKILELSKPLLSFDAQGRADVLFNDPNILI
jgi:hypothetical protein